MQVLLINRLNQDIRDMMIDRKHRRAPLPNKTAFLGFAGYLIAAVVVEPCKQLPVTKIAATDGYGSQSLSVNRFLGLLAKRITKAITL